MMRSLLRHVMHCGLIWAACSVAPALAATLPQHHPYQVELRKFFAGLTEKDYEIEVKPATLVPPGDDLDALYRASLLQYELPRVGNKRSAPSVNLPASQFVLSYIEGRDTVVRPGVWPEPTAWLANWKYAGNPYFGSRALKLRAFITATIDMMMTDDLQEHGDFAPARRADWFGPHLLMYAYTYGAVRDELPANVRKAFEAELKKLILRTETWGLRGDETFFDLSAVTAMGLAAKATGDPELAEVAERHARRLFEDKRFYHPAGYFVDAGCFDAGFNGLSLYFATWLALSNDWPFAREAVSQACKLRSYLALPDPDGTLVGPSHFNSRTSSDVMHDQWAWPFRIQAQALLTDEAACNVSFPTSVEAMHRGVASAISMLNFDLQQSGAILARKTPESSAWAWRLWPNAPAFPMNNYAYDNYPAGYYARRLALEKCDSPLTKYPFQRSAPFLETFDKAFVIAKTATAGAVIHTGPVGAYQGEGYSKHSGPYGLGGGCLSAFWTPATGSVLLGRRGGMTIRGPDAVTFDKAEAWRTWPIHAVSGATAEGKFFTSGRIENPDVQQTISEGRAEIQASGVIPAVTMGDEQALTGKIEYSRKFQLDDQALRITTTVRGDGADQVAELYETLPVFLRDAEKQKPPLATKIEFKLAGKWRPATADVRAKVTTVRLSRFDGAVVITFDQPQSVKLSPEDWKDTYLSQAHCRNVLIDLLATGKKSTLKKGLTLSYSIAAEAR